MQLNYSSASSTAFGNHRHRQESNNSLLPQTAHTYSSSLRYIHTRSRTRTLLRNGRARTPAAAVTPATSISKQTTGHYTPMYIHTLYIYTYTYTTRGARELVKRENLSRKSATARLRREEREHERGRGRERKKFEALSGQGTDGPFFSLSRRGEEKGRRRCAPSARSLRCYYIRKGIW